MRSRVIDFDFASSLLSVLLRPHAPLPARDLRPAKVDLQPRYKRNDAPHRSVALLLVLLGCLPFAPSIAEGQDREACLECGLIGHAGWNQPDAKLPDGTETSLFASNDSWTLRKRVDEVTVFFTATNGHKFVQGLNEDNIRVKDDGKPAARISAFGYQRDLPLRLGLVVDTSSSVNPQFRVQQRAAIQFLQQIVRPGRDRAFVLGFANDIDVTQDYSDDPEHLASAVQALRQGGGTAMFDAISKASDKLTTPQDSEPTARILIVLSDGDDNASRATLSQAVDKAQMREVTIYTMDTTTDRYKPGDLQSPGRLALKRLAGETGGRAFYDMEKWEVTKAFSAIEQEIRNRYALSYQPADLKEDGRFHRIEIEAEKSGKGVRIHTRKGYYARLVSETE